MEPIDLINAAKILLPIPILFFVFGGTYTIGKLYENKHGKAPWWLIGVPFFLGGALGTAHYFVIADLQSLAARSIWFHIASAVILGGAYGGAEIFLWTKIAKRMFTSDNTPTERAPQ